MMSGINQPFVLILLLCPPLNSLPNLLSGSPLGFIARVHHWQKQRGRREKTGDEKTSKLWPKSSVFSPSLLCTCSILSHSDVGLSPRPLGKSYLAEINPTTLEVPFSISSFDAGGIYDNSMPFFSPLAIGKRANLHIGTPIGVWEGESSIETLHKIGLQ